MDETWQNFVTGERTLPPFYTLTISTTTLGARASTFIGEAGREGGSTSIEDVGREETSTSIGDGEREAMFDIDGVAGDDLRKSEVRSSACPLRLTSKTTLNIWKQTLMELASGNERPGG